MNYRILVAFVLFFGSFACSKNDDNTSDCQFTTIISSDEYENAPSGGLIINNLEINGSCLKINFTSGGCNGDSWELKLIDSGDILKLGLPQRTLRLSLKNEELCYALITKEVTFEISNLRLEGSNKLQLNIKNSDDTILYKY
ncbi:hypothetical protein [Confluentibacter sediminis]|uniref:hypothetical protein n=1 Tax=Confluentibacter sediminis TaxID=2219045 RepID=UPI000DAEC7B9|nr:hypothetical protein [Confluentibacter sediminis]